MTSHPITQDAERIAYLQLESLKNLLGPPSDADIRWAARRISRDLTATQSLSEWRDSPEAIERAATKLANFASEGRPKQLNERPEYLQNYYRNAVRVVLDALPIPPGSEQP
jgi:hypothetical protein